MLIYLSLYQVYIYFYKGLFFFLFLASLFVQTPLLWPLFLIKYSLISYGPYRAIAKEHLDLNSFGKQLGFLSICFFPPGPLSCLPAWGALVSDLWKNQLPIARFPMETWLPRGNRERALMKQRNHVIVCWSDSEEWQMLLVKHFVSSELLCWWLCPRASCSRKTVLLSDLIPSSILHWGSAGLARERLVTTQQPAFGGTSCVCRQTEQSFGTHPAPGATEPFPHGRCPFCPATSFSHLIRLAHGYWIFCLLFLDAGVSRCCQDQ